MEKHGSRYSFTDKCLYASGLMVWITGAGMELVASYDATGHPAALSYEQNALLAWLFGLGGAPLLWLIMAKVVLTLVAAEVLRWRRAPAWAAAVVWLAIGVPSWLVAHHNFHLV